MAKHPCQTGYRCLWGRAVDDWGVHIVCSLPACAIVVHRDGFEDTIQGRRLVLRTGKEPTDGTDA